MKLKILALAFILLSANIYSQTEMNRKIAVTIDDLPLQRISHFDNRNLHRITDKLLGKIKYQNIPAVGFVNEDKLQIDGRNDGSKIDLLKKWLAAGLDLGNHTFSHRSANSIPVEEYKTDILNGERILRNIITESGKKLAYFRHPFLQTGRSLEVKNEIENFLADHNYIIAPVTIDNSEWIFGGAYDKAIDSSDTEMMKRIGEEYIKYMKLKVQYWESQSVSLLGRNINHILLVHANTLNADYFDKLCGMLRSTGYEFIALDEALKDEVYKSDDKFTGAGGISWLHRWAVTQKKERGFFGSEPLTPELILNYAGIKSE